MKKKIKFFELFSSAFLHSLNLHTAACHASFISTGAGEDNGAEICLKWKTSCWLYLTLFLPSISPLFCRLKNFCGSIADAVGSKTNIIRIRYYVEASAINSTFAILYTAIREKANQNGNNSLNFSSLIAFFPTYWIIFITFFTPFLIPRTYACTFFNPPPLACTTFIENCRDDEFDCEDQNCIKKDLECNGFENCRFKSDEHDKCPVSIKTFTE